MALMKCNRRRRFQHSFPSCLARPCLVIGQVRAHIERRRHPSSRVPQACGRA